MSLFDIDKTYNGKGTALLYKCVKCKKENETILFDEKWFRPNDENESMLAKSVRKISNLFSEKKKTDGYFIKIKIRIPIPTPFLELEPRPHTKPEREVKVQPEWEEELV